jgi:hypothetical protein
MNKITICQFALITMLVLGCQTPQVDLKPIDCRKFLIIPPGHFDLSASKFVSKSWMQLLKKRKSFRKCDSIVNFDKSNEVFTFLNISHDDPTHPSKFGASQLSFLKEKTEATHLVRLAYRVRGSDLVIGSEIYRIEPLKRERLKKVDDTVKARLARRNPFKAAKKRAFTLRLFSLLPNAFTGGYSSSTIINQRELDGDVTIVSQRENTVLPPILSAFSATSVEHPYGFDTWDISARPFISFNAHYFDTSYVFRHRLIDSSGEEIPLETTYNLIIGIVSPNINYEVSLHTIIGATYLSIGAGLGAYVWRDSFNNGSGILPSLRLGIGHRVFVNEQWYIDGSISALGVDTDIENEVMKFQQIDTASLILGYFFPVKNFAQQNL